MFDEEESKRLRIFQRFQRQELQLIIERCNEVAFDYICLPSIRSDKDLCFGSKTPRKIHLFSDDKSVNSYIRKCFKEHFPEPVNAVSSTEVKTSEEEICDDVEIKLSYPFSSRVPRFQDITIDSTGVYRRKRKTKETPITEKKCFSVFGSSKNREFLVTRNYKEKEIPGVGAYNLTKTKKNFYHHSFGGEVVIEPAFNILCSPTNLDTKCGKCDEKPKNVYWKNKKTRAVLCRPCLNVSMEEIKQKSRGILEQLRKSEEMKRNYEKKRSCDFYHQHNNTTAAVRLLSSKEFHRRIKKVNFLNTLFNY